MVEIDLGLSDDPQEGISNHVATWDRGRNPTTFKKPQSNKLRRGDARAEVRGRPAHLAWWKVNDPLESHDLGLTHPTLTQRLGGSSRP